jgi:hypothetical protein
VTIKGERPLPVLGEGGDPGLGPGETGGPPHMAQAFRYPSYISWPLPQPNEALETLVWLLTQTERVVNPAVSASRKQA